MQTTPILFDQKLREKRRTRAAKNFARYDFLVAAAAEEIAEHLALLGVSPTRALVLGAHSGQMTRHFAPEQLLQCDTSHAMLSHARGARVVVDEEYLPFAPASFDAVLSLFHAHWINDVTGAWVQVRHALKPRAPFVAVFLGGETLSTLRAVLAHAESEIRGGASPRVSPTIDPREVAGLASRAGFKEPVVGCHTLYVQYKNVRALLHDLRGMGQTAALVSRDARGLSRRILAAAEALYPRNSEGEIRVEFDFISLTAWST